MISEDGFHVQCGTLGVGQGAVRCRGQRARGMGGKQESRRRDLDALMSQLLYAQAMLNNTCGKDINNPELNEMLLKLRLLAMGKRRRPAALA